MSNKLVTGSILDIISFAAEIAVLLWFFDGMQDKKEQSGNLLRQTAGVLPLAALLLIYLTPLNAAFSVFSIQNLAIQILRMFLHLLPVMFWLLINKDCSASVAAYLSAIFTAIYLTAQNLRMVVMTYGIATPLHQATGTGYVVGLVLTAVAEFVLAALMRKLIRPEKIDTIDKQRAIMMSIVLFIMVYFKWILTAVRELNIGGNRIMMISFSVVTSIGLCLVILLYDYSRLLLKEKKQSEFERTILQYEIRSAKHEMQASDDVRRLYHDVKNHLLAIQSMAGSEGEVNEYLQELLPQFEGYETQVRTGNQTVDAILSEKIQIAGRDGIRFNVFLDLSQLDGIKTVDLVTIFGNAVDNAIEALRKTEDDEKYVYIKSSTTANHAVIRFENRFSGAVELKNGVPVTSKKDADMHGIGIRSIRNAAGRYGGTVSAKADNNSRTFTLVVMLPFSQKQEEAEDKV